MTSDLYKYEFKTVKIVTKEGKSYTGYVGFYCSAEDADDPEDSIGIFPSEDSRAGVGLFASDIQSIEIIE